MSFTEMMQQVIAEIKRSPAFTLSLRDIQGPHLQDLKIDHLDTALAAYLFNRCHKGGVSLPEQTCMSFLHGGKRSLRTWTTAR